MEAVLIESATKYEVIKLLIFSTGIESLAPTAGTNGFNPGPEESGFVSSVRLIKSAKKYEQKDKVDKAKKNYEKAQK